MTSTVSLVRFFRIVPTVPPLTLYAFGAVVACALVTAAVDPSRTDRALVPLVVLQGFATSSSLLAPARRGYYDLLLTSGAGRLRVSGIHWLMSAAPGVASWIVVAASEFILTSGTRHAAAASGTMVAMVIVSTISWAATISLPRFAGAIAWLLLALMTSTFVPAQGMTLLGDHQPLPVVVLPLVYPVAILGRDVTGQPWMVVPALVVAVICMAAALVWILWKDIPLEAAQ